MLEYQVSRSTVLRRVFKWSKIRSSPAYRNLKCLVHCPITEHECLVFLFAVDFIFNIIAESKYPAQDLGRRVDCDLFGQLLQFMSTIAPGPLPSISEACGM